MVTQIARHSVLTSVEIGSSLEDLDCRRRLFRSVVGKLKKHGDDQVGGTGKTQPGIGEPAGNDSEDANNPEGTLQADEGDEDSYEVYEKKGGKRGQAKGRKTPAPKRTKPAPKRRPPGLMNLQPIKDIEEIFKHMFENIKSIYATEVTSLLNKVKDRPLRIGTMCSGTECPIIVLELFNELLSQGDEKINFEHRFSVEVVAFKQAYIQRNWLELLLYKDVIDVAREIKEDGQKGTTVFGTKVEIPRDLDILVAGFVCKDFSTLNNYKKNLEERGESGDTFFSILEYIVAARPKMVLFENVKNAPWSNEAQRTKFKERLRDAEIKKMKKNKTWNRGTLRSKIPLPENWEEIFVAAQRDKRQTKTQYGIDAMMQDIGYVAKHLDLDTKDYYLPQTRQRGYMLCIDGRWFIEGADVEDGRDVQELAEPELEKWASMVEALKHEASVPAEMMLLAASSETKTSILLPEKPGGETGERDWTKCRIRHTKGRDTYQLEEKRQLTNWKESGGKLLPDFWATTRGMTNRVMDLLEIVHLLSLMHRIDDRYYSHIFDLSQNVDRGKLGKPETGIVQCIIPSGMKWWTSNGRMINGKEALLLQGLPINRMDLSYLSEPYLHELAGNAMSSTVIGATLISALATFTRLLETDGDQDSTRPPRELRSSPEFSRPYDLVEHEVDMTAVLEPISAEGAIQLVQATSALCHCEGTDDMLTKKFLSCKVCHHTTCAEHGGNSKHSYRQDKRNRKYPAEFETRIKKALPKLIKFANISLDGIPKDATASIDKENLNTVADTFRKAVRSEFYLTSITRSDIWEVVYESTTGQLLLEISCRGVQWLVYGKVPPALGLKDVERVRLEKFPLARSQLRGEVDITKGGWELWFPHKHDIQASVKFAGGLKVESFESERGFMAASDTWVFKSCTLLVDDAYPEAHISGKYKLRPKCGQPFNSLHFRATNNNADPPLFIFFDHQPQNGNANDHHFVCSEDVRKLQFGKHRQVIANFPPEFEQPRFKKVRVGEAVQFQRMKQHVLANHLLVAEMDNRKDIEDIKESPKNEIRGLEDEESCVTTEKVTLTVDGTWSKVPLSFDLDVGKMVQHRRLCDTAAALAEIPAENTECQKLNPRLIFECEAETTRPITILHKQGEWNAVNPRNQVNFYRTFKYFLEGDRTVQSYHDNDPVWQEQKVLPGSRCLECAPKLPDILWSWVEGRKMHPNAKKSYQVTQKDENDDEEDDGEGDAVVEPEDAEEAEAAGENLVAADNETYSNSEESSDNEDESDDEGMENGEDAQGGDVENGEMAANIGRHIPVESPQEAHQYETTLKNRPQGIQAAFSIANSIEGYNKVTFMVGIVPETLLHRATALLKFSEGMEDIAEEEDITTEWALTTVSNEHSRQSLKPFILESTPKPSGSVSQPDGWAKRRLKLFPQQLNSLAWQVKQEKSPRPFIEQEIVEARIPQLHYRIMGKATRAVSRPGGVLAHGVGFGKTIVMMALIEKRKATDRKQAKKKLQEGRISLKATLVFVPHHLVDQWKQEAEKFLFKPTIVAIERISDLEGHTIDSFQDADIIIVGSKIYRDEYKEYLERLAKLAGMIPPDTKASLRAQDLWYQTALRNIKNNIGILLDQYTNDPAGFAAEVNGQRREAARISFAVKVSVPSKRAVGSENLREEDGREADAEADLEILRAMDLTENVEFFAEDSDTFSGGASWKSMDHLVLEMFYFSRIIIDEFPYAKERTGRRLMTGCRGYARWLLSGTPPLNEFAEIKLMAELLDVSLGIDDYSSMTKSEFQKAASEKTSTETLMMYQPPPSASWIKERHEHAQRFLEHFCRKDFPEEGEIKCKAEIRLVKQPPAERAGYLEVEQFLTLNSLLIPASPPNTDSNSDLQLKDALRGFNHSEEALLWRAGYYKHNLTGIKDCPEPIPTRQKGKSDMCDEIVRVRKDDCEDLYTKFKAMFEVADWLQKQPGTKDYDGYQKFKKMMTANATKKLLSDQNVSEEIKKILSAVSGDFESATEEFQFGCSLIRLNHEKAFSGQSDAFFKAVWLSAGMKKPRGYHYLRLATLKLENQTKELIRRQRSLRFAEVVRDVQGEKDLSCNCCSSQISKDNATIIFSCGHIVCNECRRLGQCLVNLCDTKVAENQFIPAIEFALEDEFYHTGYGEKLESMVNLITEIQGKNERALLFIQQPRMIEMACEILRADEHRIAVEVLDNKSSTAITNFQKGTSEHTVLILNIGDESAAGCNLTIAKNVIFLAPYFTTGSHAEEVYMAAVKQAIGRVVRYGQREEVKIYHFLTSKTMDIDLYEEREERVVLKADEERVVRDRKRNDNETGLNGTYYASRIWRMVLGRDELQDEAVEESESESDRDNREDEAVQQDFEGGDGQ